jgi:hypothetical protein
MRHATDGALVRWLDGECDGAERLTLSRHFDDCAGCRARLGRTRARSEVLRRALRVHPPRVRAGRWRTAGIAAAGLVALAAVQPVRAWVVAQAGAIWAAVVGATGQSSARTVPAGTGEGSVSFVPTGDTLTVQIRSRQRAGRLTVEFQNAAVATARLAGDAAGAALLVLPAGIQIANAPSSRASYLLQLPATLTMVIVKLADEPPERLEPLANRQWSLDLGARRAP